MRVMTACMRCGSLALRSPKASEGGIGVAFFDRVLCRDCGWQGFPLEFATEAEWREFLRAKREEKGASAPAQDGQQVPVRACPQCGARDLRLEGTASACPHCLWRGTPVAFASEAEWRTFAASRRNRGGAGGEAG